MYKLNAFLLFSLLAFSKFAGAVSGQPPLPDELARAEHEETEGQVRELMENYGPVDVMWWDGHAAMSPEELADLQSDILVARLN